MLKRHSLAEGSSLDVHLVDKHLMRRLVEQNTVFVWAHVTQYMFRLYETLRQI